MSKPGVNVGPGGGKKEKKKWVWKTYLLPTDKVQEILKGTGKNKNIYKI